MKKSARILLCFICAPLIAMPLAGLCPAQNVEAAEKQTAESTKAAGKKTEKKKKVLLAYYSQSGTTEKVAKRIEKMTGATLFRIQTKKKYPSNYDKPLTPAIMPFFDVAPETRQLTVWLVLIHNVFNCVAFPFADPLGKGLRAAGDVKFTMVWSIITTIGVRLLFSVLFAIVLQMGVTGIAIAMCMDWCIRAVVFYIRFRDGKWKQYQLI